MAKTTKFKQTDIGPIPEDWEMKRLEDILYYEQPQKYIVKSTVYTDHGVPVLTPGKTFVLGFTSECFGVCSSLPIILFDDFLTISRYIDFRFKLKSSAVKLLRQINDHDDLYFISQAMTRIGFVPGDHQRHWISIYSKFSIMLPPSGEQGKIAKALKNVDDLINAYDQLIKKKTALKTGAMQELLTGKRRLPGFSGEWVEKRLGNVADFQSDTIIPSTLKQLNYVGTENMRQNFMGVDFLPNDSHYLRVRNYITDDILISNIRPYLKKIWLADRCGGCSTDVHVLRVIDTTVDLPQFIAFSLQTDAFVDHCMSSVTGTKMPRGNKKVLLEYIVSMPPTLAEQVAIADAINDMATEIAALENESDKYQKIKQGMMHELLTGRVRLEVA